MNTIVDKAIPTIEKRPLLSFLISLSLPLLQVTLVYLFFLMDNSFNNVERLYISTIGVFTIGLVSDLVGIIIAMFGIRKRGDKKCTFPLVINLFFAVPKALILLLLFSF